MVTVFINHRTGATECPMDQIEHELCDAAAICRHKPAQSQIKNMDCGKENQGEGMETKQYKHQIDSYFQTRVEEGM